MLDRVNRLSALLLALTMAGAASAQVGPAASPLQFRVTFAVPDQQTPYSGRVYVVLAQDGRSEPRLNMTNWFSPPQMLAMDVSGVEPGSSILIGQNALSYPDKLADVPAQAYQIQAVARRSPDSPSPGVGPGDWYSEARQESIDPAGARVIELALTKVVEKRPFRETDRVKETEIVSKLLSEFHGREIRMQAAVVLPEGWKDDPSVRYPVLYMGTGFGGDHGAARHVARGRRAGSLADRVLLVVPNPICYRGHSVFADSANNGPWGRALIEELIPHVEKKFHGAQSGKHRYLTGVSSGGWMSLWLQVTYPDMFNGCWAHVPDPVDFRDFQTINLYDPTDNVFVDKAGKRRGLARFGNRIMLYYDDFVAREEVVGEGGQIRSFEACFSPRGPDGEPLRVFDRKTGKTNVEVAKAWEKYDIRLVLERNWSALAPKLAGKIHVFAGEKDTFYLNGAAAKLRDSLAKLGSDAEVRVVPGMGHSPYSPAFATMYKTITENYYSPSKAKAKPSEPANTNPEP